MKNEENIFVDESEIGNEGYPSKCTICKLFIRDLNSHWYAQNGLRKDEVVNFLENYAKSLPEELEISANNLIENRKQVLLTQILAGKPPFENVCKTLLGCN